MKKKHTLNFWWAISLFLLGICCTFSTTVFADEVSWIHGQTPPELEIYPANPTTEDVIYFTNDLRDEEVFDNSCLAEQEMDGILTLTIETVNQNIKVLFESPAPVNCPNEFDPVCGLEGSVGPLGPGEWTLWFYFPGRINWLSFQVGSVHFVDADATGANDGTSWNNAYNYLKDALADASPHDQVWVAEGVYNPDRNSSNPTGTGDRTDTFQLINDIVVKGGYAGFGAPDPNLRDVETYNTILSGDLNHDDIGDFDDASRDENSYHVVTASGTDNTAVLDGFTITAGNADGSAPNNKGAGMYNYAGSPTISNCAFSENFASQKGGGIYNDNSVLALTNCIISDNVTSNDGGGLYNYDNSNLTLTDCTVSNNAAGNDGGGAFNYSDMILVNCIINNNTSGNNGGAVANKSDLTIKSSMISANSAAEYGGAVYNWQCNSTLTNCTFTKNSASIGNALAYDSVGTSQVNNCILWDGGSEIWYNESMNITITYSDIQNGWPGGGNNIDIDPNFVDPNGPDSDPNTCQDNDYHLIWDSLCINAGDPGYNPGNLQDIDAEPRVMLSRVDIGADEVGEKQADFTRDGIINFDDFVVLGQAWSSSIGEENWYRLCDLYEDEQINISDLAEYVNNWLWQASWYGN